MLIISLCCAGTLFATSPATHVEGGPLDGKWNARLESPGGDLRFGLEIETKGGESHAWITNGRERLPVPGVSVVGATLVLDFVHYDSVLRATAVDLTLTDAATGEAMDSSAALSGSWSKRTGPDSWTTMSFLATRGQATHDGQHELVMRDESLSGRWSVDFSSTEDPSVGIFEVDKYGNASGTFLTTLGDYRYLGGTFDGATLELSCFDGAHAFLFRAKFQDDGSLAGDFWSRDTWHETWTAVRDDDAALPDSWGLTSWTGDASLGSFEFLDANGKRIALDDARFDGKARIIEVFGTWCPNCNDATRYLIELHEKYADRGLSITGLAFEITGDEQRDIEQITKYIGHHGIQYPILLAGISDKASATKAFPVLDRVRSYPTFIFLDSDDAVRGIYTGFSGPATGAEHETLRESFERLIEQLLGA